MEKLLQLTIQRLEPESNSYLLTNQQLGAITFAWPTTT